MSSANKENEKEVKADHSHGEDECHVIEMCDNEERKVKFDPDINS